MVENHSAFLHKPSRKPLIIFIILIKKASLLESLVAIVVPFFCLDGVLCCKNDFPGARSKFWGVSGSEDRGGGDNSIQFINIGREGDKSFKEWRRKIGGWKGG